jgi:pyrophosphatase PpaX
MPFRIRSWEHALRQCGQPIPDLKTFLAQTVGEPLEQQMERLSGPALAPALIAAYRAYYYTHHLDHLALYPGVYVAVQRLHDLGAAIAVVSSKLRAGVAEEVRALGLAPYVTLVVGPEDTPRPKPDPAPARFALQRLGVPAERALFVGDSPLDIYCGRAAGTRTIGALWGCHDRDYLRSARPDYEAESPAEVVAIASGLFVR